MIPITLNNDQNRIIGKAVPTDDGRMIITFADDFVCTRKMFVEMFDGGFFVNEAEYVGPRAVYRILEAEIVSFNVDQPVDVYEWPEKGFTADESVFVAMEEARRYSEPDLPTDDLSVARRIWNAIRRKKHRRIVFMDDTNPSGFRLLLSYKARVCDVDDKHNIGIFDAKTPLYVIERAVKKHSSKKGGWAII